MSTRLLAGAIALACLAAPVEARHVRHAPPVPHSGPMTCDTDGRCKGGGSLPEFSSVLPFRSGGLHSRHRTVRPVARHAGNLCTAQGRCSTVVGWAVEKFRGLVADLEHLGYAIGSPGCYSPTGHMRNSKHHWGGACDLFNQVARDRTALRQPPPSIQIEVAAKHGLISGCSWRNRDCGHFEVSRR